MADIVHMFIWISHGGNVSAKSNFYPMDTKFKTILLYSTPFNSYNASDIDKLRTTPCALVLGTCPYIPINDGHGKSVFLPPLLFVNRHPENDPLVVRATGFYHVIIYKELGTDVNVTSSISSNCAQRSDKICNYDDFIRQYGTRHITYSMIFQLAMEQCTRLQLNPESVLLGIISCQTAIPSYVGKYKDTITNFVPTHVNPPIQSTIFDLTHFPPNTFVAPTILPFTTVPEKWTKLADISHQGCALNVLAYFGIIEQTYATEQAVCLSRKGTSIFRIVDYISNYLHNLHIPFIGFFIFRYNIIPGLVYLGNLIQKLITINNFVIVFKMYADFEFGEQTKSKSHFGHTVAIAKYGADVYYIDPQVGISAKILKTFFENTTQISDLYKTNIPWRFIDIIYTVTTTPPNMMPSDTQGTISVFIQNIVTSNTQNNIITKTNVNFGG